MLITAIHNAGLVSFTHTPGIVEFLNKILKKTLKRTALFDFGRWLSSKDTTVPNITKKDLREINAIVFLLLNWVKKTFVLHTLAVMLYQHHTLKNDT